MKMELKDQQKIFDALLIISGYQNSEELREGSEEEYGLEYEEALEMAYENILETAKFAVKGLRRPS